MPLYVIIILYVITGALMGILFAGDLGAGFGIVFTGFSAVIFWGIYLLPEQKKEKITNRISYQGDFMVILLTLSASVIRSDGAVLTSELTYVKNYFLRQFGEIKTNHYISLLKKILDETFDLEAVCNEAKVYMNVSYRLQLTHYLFGVAFADGQLNNSELSKIKIIAEYLGVSTADFESIKAMYVKTDDGAYVILEITKNATNEEIKRAYRRMAMKYHPDKVSYLGEEVQKAAHEKFKKIGDAYKQIKLERGIA